jgi:hypothetical protein
MLKKLFTLTLRSNKNIFKLLPNHLFNPFKYSFTTKLDFETEEDFIDRSFKQIYHLSSFNNFDDTENKIKDLITHLSNNKYNNISNIYDATTLAIDNYIKQAKYEEGINYINEYINSLEYVTDDILKNDILVGVRDKLAFIYGSIKQWDTAINLLNDNVTIIRERIKEDTINLKSDYINLASSLTNLSNIYLDMQEPSYKVKPIFNELSIIYTMYPDDLKRMGVHVYKYNGNSAFELENFEEALTGFASALKIKRELAEDDDQESFEINYSIGSSFLKMEDFDKSIEAYKDSANIKTKLIARTNPSEMDQTPYVELGKGYEKIADLYQYKEDFSSCLEFINKARENYLKTSTPILLANVYLTAASACFYKAQYDKSIEYAKKYIKLIDTADDQNLIMIESNKELSNINKYKMFKTIAESYKKIGQDEKCKKYCSICTNIIKNTTSENNGTEFIFKQLELGRLYSLSNKFEYAMNAYDDILSIINTDPEAVEGGHLLALDCHYKKADIYISLDKWNEAKSLLEEILESINDKQIEVPVEKYDEILKKYNNINIKIKYLSESK